MKSLLVTFIVVLTALSANAASKNEIYLKATYLNNEVHALQNLRLNYRKMLGALDELTANFAGHLAQDICFSAGELGGHVSALLSTKADASNAAINVSKVGGYLDGDKKLNDQIIALNNELDLKVQDIKDLCANQVAQDIPNRMSVILKDIEQLLKVGDADAKLTSILQRKDSEYSLLLDQAAAASN